MLNELIIIGSLVGNLTVTSYRSVQAQTDNSPFFTSTGEHVHAGGVAVSRDLLCGACRKLHHRCRHPEDDRHLHYGDWLFVGARGFYQVNDTMGKHKHYKVCALVNGHKKSVGAFKTQKKWIDLWMPDWAAEHKVGWTVQPVYKVGVKSGL